jgi:hypothetical protein
MLAYNCRRKRNALDGISLHGDDVAGRAHWPLPFRKQVDLGPGVMAFKFDEQWLRLGESRPIETEGEYALLELKHRTTYVFRLDARDPRALSLIVREVTR